MAKKRATRRGPKPFVLKVDGDVGAILDRMLGKDGSLPPKARKPRKSKRA